MKKRVLLIRLLVLTVLIVGLSSLTLKIGKEKFVQIDQKLFASRFEVTNEEFRDFLTSVEAESITCLYDSTQWVKKFPYSYNQPLVNFYHWHKAYSDYPVVNITRESAEAYCKWLTNNYDNSFRKKYKKVVFRLPTEAEWVKLSGIESKNNLPWDGNTSQGTDLSTAMANIKAHGESGKADYKFDGNLYTSKVGDYKANKYGLFDIVGNASELTQSGILKGGSWDSYIEECTADKSLTFDLPDPRVGFRVVMEIIEK